MRTTKLVLKVLRISNDITMTIISPATTLRAANNVFHFCNVSKIASQMNDVIYFPVCLKQSKKQDIFLFQNLRVKKVVISQSGEKNGEVNGNGILKLRTEKYSFVQMTVFNYSVEVTFFI